MKLTWQALRRWRWRALLALGGAALGAMVLNLAWPLPLGLLGRGEAVSLRITDRNGGLLRELRSQKDCRGAPLPGERVPPLLRAAFLAAEDRRFDSHPGVDGLAVMRALWQNARARRVVSGASTLTQQLARQLWPRPRTLGGKLLELLMALRLSAHLPREVILREYLNRVPLGNSLTGAEAAAELYFGRDAAHLSAGQAALLAGMASSPARYDPYRHLAAARQRMGRVLTQMVALGTLSAEEARVAAEAPLDLRAPEHVFKAPHLVTQLVQELPGMGLSGAARVQTALDPALQADVELLLRAELLALFDKRVGQAAAIVLDNESGEVLAYAGSADFLNEAHGGQNDGVRALRQPGSALKPFAYGLALARGYTPARLLSDVETHLATPSGDYVPKNYDRRVRGPVRLRAALANSYNVPAVRLADDLGPERVLRVLREAGFTSLDQDAAHYGVGIVLGNGDVSLRELARAYRGLALGGVLRPLVEIRAAWDAHGQPLPVPAELAPRRFLPRAAVELLTDILSDEGARAPTFGLDNALRLPFPVAVKTGTSRAYIDNWTAGFTRERTVAVWVGNFEGTPMKGVSGVTGAGPLFRRIMLRAMQGLTPRQLVDRSRFESAEICPLSGQLAGPACPGRVHEVFLPGTRPQAPCAMHRFIEGGGCIARHGREPQQRAVLDVGPAYYAWAQGEGLAAGPWEECAAPAPRAEDESAEARLLLPADGDEYLIEPGLPDSDQMIPVRALAPRGTSELEVRTDDGVRLRLRAPYTARLPARRGAHRIELWLVGTERSTQVGQSRYVVR